MERVVQTGLALLFGFSMAVLDRTEAEHLPQLAVGDSLLSVVFGDARGMISVAAVRKADSYFHGGVDIDCDDMHSHHHEHSDGGGESSCHGDHHDAGGDEGTEAEGEAAHDGSRGFDPWQWIISHVRAPEVDRHLAGGRAVEVMPWLTAAVRVDPHNTEAWSTAWYIAKHTMHDAALARRILAEAKEKNPLSMEIAFTEGCDLYDGGKGDLMAAKLAFALARTLGDRATGGDPSKFNAHDEQIYRFAGNYLQQLSLPR